MTKRDDRPPKKRGPDPETLEIEGDWEDAVKKAVKKPPPPPQSKPKERKDA